MLVSTKWVSLAITVLSFYIAVPRVSAASPAPGVSPKVSPDPTDVGIIFSSSDILLDLDNYQGGFGVKIGSGSFYLRGTLDFLLSSASSSFSVNAGATGEYHLAPGPVSPYLGAYAQVGYSLQENVIWTVPLSVGGVAGVEVSILDFISVFAEYCLAADFTFTTDLETSKTTFDYLVDTRLGNGSKLGIVVYLTRFPVKK